jgi:hypothetical protein
MKATEFVLHIELGNEAMRTRQHVAKALTDLAKRLVDERMTPQDEDLIDDGRIMDLNGNLVGEWAFQGE